MAGAAGMSDAERSRLPDSAFCGRGRTMPVLSRADLKTAIEFMMANGHMSKGDRVAMKDCLTRKARMMGAMDMMDSMMQS